MKFFIYESFWRIQQTVRLGDCALRSSISQSLRNALTSDCFFTIVARSMQYFMPLAQGSLPSKSVIPGHSSSFFLSVRFTSVQLISPCSESLHCSMIRYNIEDIRCCMMSRMSSWDSVYNVDTRLRVLHWSDLL
uniref:Uncharacterized protein n=1 Tax=Cacopsylla melanoneura TaxID=428564 RepID=A0A8D8PWV9_9HEMI